ncbi:MAG: molybdopterin-dependent oxidoreductase [Oscillochloris sp.]|nr:molybdopterin-dependent oxidoreductase [Oscillochloris sp.]
MPQIPIDAPILTRRDLLRLLGAGAGVAISGSLAGCAENPLWVRQPVTAVDSWHNGACRFCGTGCEVQIGIRDGRVVDVRGHEYGHNRGRLCIKGIVNREILYVRDRATTPLIRENGALRPASWDEAMDLVATRFRESLDQFGPTSVAFYGSGQLSTQESYTASKLFKGGFRSNNVDGNPRLCMASAAFGYVSTFFKDEPMGCYEDIDYADTFFITGSNTAECHPVVWERILDRKRRAPETFIIVVDPRRTRTARAADMHLAIRPTTDVTLYNALLAEFIRRDFVDQDMLANYLKFRQGQEDRAYADFIAHLEPYTPEFAADVCGIAPDDIREAADRFAAAPASMSLWTMGINQQFQGTAANRLLMAMHLITGQIGRPGATPFSLTGQPNAGGGVRDAGALAHTLPHGRLIANEQHRREVEAIWGIPFGTIDPTPGYDTVALFQVMERGDVKCCLVMCTNPAQSLPNLNRYRPAMEKTFLVVTDSFHPTETTELADVVLPTAMWAEKDGVYSNSERRYHRTPKLVEPPGAARSDFAILVDFAQRMGYGDLIKDQTPEEMWEEYRLTSEGTAYNFAGITSARLRDEPGILWPCPDVAHPGTCRRYVPGEDPLVEHPERRIDFYASPDGRAVVWLEDQAEPQDPRDEQYPLILTTGRVLEHWHTMTITGRVPKLEPLEPRFLQINPRDAREFGIVNEVEVTVQSRYGAADFVAQVTDDVRPGVVFATFHSARHLVNQAMRDTVDPISKEPEYKASAVYVRAK